jgi:hypothetical protein
MKKITMQTILNYINDNNVEELFGARDELTAELNKTKARKDANLAVYEKAKPVVFEALAESVTTISELYEAIQDKLPEDFTKSKLQYAITRLWADDIVKHEDKINTYSLKA